jgi:hypothetical protein
MIFKAIVEIYVDVGCEAEACDAIAESLRDHLPGHAEFETAWVDWQYAPAHMTPVPATPGEIESLEIHR